MNPKSFLPNEFAAALGLHYDKALQILMFMEMGGIVSKNNPYWGFRGLAEFTREDLQLMADKAKRKVKDEQSKTISKTKSPV
jgi:hypothetical protein